MPRYSPTGYSTLRFGGPLTNAVKLLITVNTSIFILQWLLEIGGMSPGGFWSYFGLTPARLIGQGMIWQLGTYLFFHADVFHILFNMLALWMFGSDVERQVGERKFLLYYFFCGIGAGLTIVLTSLSAELLGWAVSGFYAPTIGASGAVFGILLAFGMLFPNREVLVFFLFPMKAKHFVVLFGLLELYLAVPARGGGVSHFAHLGGLLFGFVFLRYERHMERRYHHYKLRKREMLLRHQVEEELSRDEFIRKEIDPILDKISRHGMGSLTRRERRTLKKGKPRRW